MSKTAPRILIAMLSAGLLLSQSLVEVSKAEHERREKLKGKNVKVITNADLQSVRKTPAVTMTSPKAAEGEPAVTEQMPAGQDSETAATSEPSRARMGPLEAQGPIHATQVLPETYLVENPEYALHLPDGRYAEISMLGLLDLDFSARNGPGEDIAVYARLAGLQEVMTEAEEGDVATDATAYQWWEGFWYGVLVMGERGDWEVIGQGTGRSAPEKFELGRFQSIKKIRIIFKPHNNPDLPAKFFRNHPGEFTFGIDGVEALH